MATLLYDSHDTGQYEHYFMKFRLVFSSKLLTASISADMKLLFKYAPEAFITHNSLRHLRFQELIFIFSSR